MLVWVRNSSAYPTARISLSTRLAAITLVTVLLGAAGPAWATTSTDATATAKTPLSTTSTLLPLPPPQAVQAQPTIRPTVSVSDVQLCEVGVLGELPLVPGLIGVGELFVGAGRGSQYRGGLWLGVRGEGPVWLEADAGLSLVQALTKQALGAGRVSLIDFETDLLTQVRGLVGLQFWPKVATWIGVTLNYQVSFGPNEMLVPTFFPVPLVFTDPQQRGGHQIWPGIAGGLRF